MIRISEELYKTDLDIYTKLYGVDFGVDNMERLIAVVLLCNLTQAIRRTTPETSVLDVINKIMKEEDPATNEFWIKTSFQSENLLLGEQVDFPDFGFKELKDKVAKIKEINKNVLPF